MIDTNSLLPNMVWVTERLMGSAARARKAVQEGRQRTARATLVSREVQKLAVAELRYFHRPVEQDYVVEHDEILGTGCSGAVVVGVHRKTGSRCAVKMYRKRQLRPNTIEHVREEVNIYLPLRHANVANLLGVHESNQVISFVMELCDGGELHSRLRRKRRFAEEQARRLMHEMLLALEHIHSAGIVHRDVKLQNWMYETDAEDSPIKLIDFGFATRWDGVTPMTETLGSPHYVAPEVLGRRGYTDKCDMWGLGVCAYAMIAGRYPFDAPDEAELTRTIAEGGPASFTGKAWAECSDSGKQFVARLLTRDPAQRPSATECLADPWIAEGRAERRAELVGEHPFLAKPAGRDEVLDRASTLRGVSPSREASGLLAGKSCCSLGNSLSFVRSASLPGDAPELGETSKAQVGEHVVPDLVHRMPAVISI